MKKKIEEVTLKKTTEDITLEIATQCFISLVKHGKIPNKEGIARSAWEFAEEFVKYSKKAGKL